MIFSVITPSLNCGKFLLRNIDSIRQQGFPSDQIEHWVIDGGSQDETIEILENQPDVRWISEPDRGLSEAVNKGILRARGTWIIWLNADDHLAPDACRQFLRYAAEFPDARIFSGDLAVLRYDGSLEQIVPGWPYTFEELLGARTGINQPSTIVHREAYEAVGLLDVANHYAMDYEWLVRATQRYRVVHIPRVLAYYRRRKGSITDAHLVKQFEEFLRIRRRYGRSRFSPGEFQIRLYLYTDWLRKMRWVRRGVRKVKALFGKEPLHPM